MIEGGLWYGYTLYDVYKWAETLYEWHEAMFDHAHERGITLFSTPFDETAVDLCSSRRLFETLGFEGDRVIPQVSFIDGFLNE